MFRHHHNLLVKCVAVFFGSTLFFALIPLSSLSADVKDATSTDALILRPNVKERSEASNSLAPVSRPGYKGMTEPRQYALPNGLKIVLLEDHSFPVVSCLVWYRVGSRNETPGMTGISHLLEHMLFHNVGAFKKGELAATIARNGGQFNGFTSDDFTAFFETISSAKLELPLYIEAERMRCTKFSEEDLKEEKANLAREFEEEAKDPRAQLGKEVRAAVFGQHPYSNPTMGWREDVEALGMSDLKAYYQRYYRPDNAMLIIVGDFTSERALTLIEKHFGALPKASQSYPQARATEPHLKAEHRIYMHSPNKRQLVLVSYRAPSANDADAPAMAVLEKLLNTHYSGRLKNKLIENKSCISAQSAFELKHDPGAFTFTLVPPCGGSAQKALEGLDLLVMELKNQAISDAELKRAKNRAEFEYFNEWDGPYKTGFYLGYFQSMHSWRNAYQWANKLKAVSASDIQRLARKHLIAENRVVGLLVVPSTGAPKSPVQPLNIQTKPVVPKPPSSAVLPGDRHRHPFELALSFYNGSDRIGKGIDELHTKLIADASSVAPRTEINMPLPMVQKGEPDNKNPGSIQLLAPSEELARLHNFVLKNGMKVIIFESHLSPVVEIAGAVQAGDIYDLPGKKGVSQLSVAVINGGSSKTSRGQYANLQEDMGLSPDAMVKFQTGLQVFSFQTRSLSRDVSSQLCHIANSLRDPALQETDLERAKQEIIGSLKQSEQCLARRVERALLRAQVAPSSPYYPQDAKDIAKSVTNLKVQDVRDFINQYIVPGATSLVIAGDVTPSAVIPSIEKYFGAWQAKAVSATPASKVMTVQPNPRHVIKSSLPITDKSKTVIRLGRLLPLEQGRSESLAELLVADCALVNHPFFARLIRSINNEPSLSGSLPADELKSRFIPLGSSMVWCLSIPAEPKLVLRTMASVRHELGRFVQSGMSLDELNEVKRYLTGAIPVRQMSNISDISKSILESSITGASPDIMQHTLKQLRALTLTTVNKFIKEEFKPDLSSTIVAGTRQAIRDVHHADIRQGASGN